MASRSWSLHYDKTTWGWVRRAALARFGTAVDREIEGASTKRTAVRAVGRFTERFRTMVLFRWQSTELPRKILVQGYYQ